MKTFSFRWSIGLAFVAFCSLLAAPTLAQTGTIAGVVIDGDTGDTMIGANVSIEGTMIGTTTGIDGDFQFKADVGTYTVLFSFIGYNPVRVQNVEVKDGEVTRLEVTMSFQTEELAEIIVEARALQNTEASLLSQRAKAAGVSDAISAEAISRSGSGDAAAAMTKVTGASVVGGRYVYIRGLGDRYTNTTLNGSTLPSADPDRKAFQLDLFPSSLLDNIVTLKTFTPDKPGDFSGGLVDVSTKTFPDAFTLQISSSLTYDSNASFNDNFLSYDGGGTDWLGYDDGARALPSALEEKDPESQLPSQADLRDTRRGVTNEIRTARADSLNAFARAFNTRMLPTIEAAPVNYSFSTAIGGTGSLFGKPLGYTGSVTYGRSYTYYDDGEFGQWALRGGSVNDVDNLIAETYFGASPNPDQVSGADEMELDSYANTQGSDEATWGLSGTLAYRLTPTNEINFTALRTQSAETQATLLAGFRDQSRTATYLTRSLDYEERSLQTYQLRGEHAFSPLLVEWKASYGKNTQEEPDLRFFTNTADIRDFASGVDTLYSLGGGNAPPPQRFFRDLSEDNLGFKLDVTYDFKQWNGLGAKVKVGGALDASERIFRQRRFEYNEGRSIDFRDFDGDIDGYFSESSLGVLDTLQVRDLVAYNAGLYITENSPALANYDATRDVAAGYAMIELPLTAKLKLIGGARYETTQVESISQDERLADSLRIGTLDNKDWLPSLNAVYALRDNMNLRAAAARTLARPTFRELAPFQSFDFVGGDILEGNPLLNRTLITNYDVRWEWFLNPGEILAISGFYKQFDNPIERVLRTVGEGRFISFQNVPEATVYGLEFEVRKGLASYTSNPFLSRLVLGGNFSLIQSEVDIPEEEMVIIRAADPDAEGTRQLEGQSPFLVNLNAGYENYETGTAISLYYNIFGDRLAVVTQGATPDVFEKGYADLDLTISQRYKNHWRLKITAKNLLGTNSQQIQTFKDTEYTYFGYTRSRTISVGLSYVID
ncbi:MAG: TonB-dependent receptor [Rhodothermales bacterium]